MAADDFYLAGEKTYRCPLPSDYNSMQPAPLGYHLERYNFPHWQNNTDLKSPLQPTSPGASPNPKLRPKSRENWSPAAGHYLSLESREEDTPSIKKQSDIPDKDPGTDSSQHSQARKSQHEPLDLSVRPEGLAYHTDKSPGAPVQGSSSYNDGHASTVTPKLQSYPADAGAGLHANNTFESDLAEEENYMEDAEYGCLLNHESTSHNGGGAFERSVSDQERGEEKEEGSKWKMLNKNDVGTDERGQENADVQGPGEGLQPPYGKLGQWGMIESPISSLERFTPGEGHLLQHHRNLLSVLRSPGGLSNMAPSGLKTSVNSGDTIEKEVTSVRKPFQCRYCPYSASQKGNLKTHVLCVHRKPFDNSLYPDRRLRRSHAPRRPSHLPPGITGDTCTPGREQITMTSLCGT
ncbi:uncharacterized protein LOC130114585 [Lampris incognitus]|uniref:uncharacterized protein LOC130114585 n=1 Tax=Lampris incognitus TaxID=2546036 RepID=UPI0024B4DA16|nr:uncharacterized protein LOC130114585 [Lampris incognitus]